MFCKVCGRETENQNNICNECLKNMPQNNNLNFEDKGGFKYGLLGFLFPFSGIVLYYMLKDKEPKLTKSFIIGAIINLIFLVFIFFFIFVTLFISSLI